MPMYLDLARITRDRVAAELDAVARERSPFFVLNRYYASAADASIEKGRIIERCLRDLERLDAAILALTMEDDEDAIRYGAIAPACAGGRDCTDDEPCQHCVLAADVFNRERVA